VNSGDRLFPVSIEEQIASVEREIRMRESAYPRWVEQRRMTVKTAEHEIACMHAVLATLQRIAAEEGHERAAALGH
jgi:signal recognition particle subunit SEC65